MPKHTSKYFPAPSPAPKKSPKANTSKYFAQTKPVPEEATSKYFKSDKPATRKSAALDGFKTGKKTRDTEAKQTAAMLELTPLERKAEIRKLTKQARAEGEARRDPNQFKGKLDSFKFKKK